MSSGTRFKMFGVMLCVLKSDLQQGRGKGVRIEIKKNQSDSVVIFVLLLVPFWRCGFRKINNYMGRFETPRHDWCVLNILRATIVLPRIAS